MENSELEAIRVAVFVMDGVEAAELTGPLNALRQAGATVEIISRDRADVQAFDGLVPTVKVAVDKTFAEVTSEGYDALLLPGGVLNADALRAVPEAQAFAAAFDNADKPIAAMCHAPWLLASADLLEGRTLTSFHTIHDDIENAGGTWVDQSTVSDGNLLTTRQRADIPDFTERMVSLFAAARKPLLAMSL